MENGFILGNKIFDIVVVALIIAQTMKVIISLFTDKKLNFRKFLDTACLRLDSDSKKAIRQYHRPGEFPAILSLYMPELSRS